MKWFLFYIILILLFSKMFVTNSAGDDGFRYDRQEWYYGLNILNFIFSGFILLTIFAIFL